MYPKCLICHEEVADDNAWWPVANGGICTHCLLQKYTCDECGIEISPNQFILNKNRCQAHK